MTITEIQSPAFKLAALRSEVRRALWLLVSLAAGLVVIIARAVSATENEADLLIGATGVLTALAAYEGGMFFLLRRRVQDEIHPSAIFWVVNLFVEMLAPTILLFLIVWSSFVQPFDALVLPAGLLYFYFMILSVLRLNPSLSRLTGLFSSAGYLVVLAYLLAQYPPPVEELGDFPLPVYFTYAFLLLVGGFVAGEVARELNTHVVAALREAETRSQMEKIENDLDIARFIQQGLLPNEAPELDGFDLAGWNQPADATGGDYYDWMTLPDGRILITLADVTGHGIGPALVSAVCRAYNRARARTTDTLSSELSFINDLLKEDLPPDRFVTFVVALLDPATAVLHLLSAGHAPLFYYKAETNRIESFEAHGIPLGLMANYEFGDPQEIKMSSGDMLILVTDGFFEWQNEEEEEYGNGRLSECIINARENTSDQIITHLYEDVRSFAGLIEQEDDLTAVILKRI